MSALGGHISHVHEDLSLTFADIREILTLAAEGDLVCEEKFDGVNLFAKGNPGDLRFARNKGDLKRGGMSLPDVRSRFLGRGSVETAFVEGSQAISDSRADFPDWTSLEIVHAANPNVIRYDHNAVVIHSKGPHPRAFPPGWRILGPTPVQLSTVPVKTYRLALEALDKASEHQITLDSLVAGKVWKAVGGLLNKCDFDGDVARKINDRVMNYPGATMVDIRRMVSKSAYQTISQFVRDSPALIKDALRPIQQAIYPLAAAALRDCASVLLDDPKAEQHRIRTDFLHETIQLAFCGTEEECSRGRNATDLKALVLDAVPIEGVVFQFKGKTYKFTGAFAAINQVMGARKYSR